jgi:large subunit ribosomal protein L16
MGSGKGSPEYWVAVVKPAACSYRKSRAWATIWRWSPRLAGHKLPIKTKIVKRQDNIECGW